MISQELLLIIMHAFAREHTHTHRYFMCFFLLKSKELKYRFGQRLKLFLIAFNDVSVLQTLEDGKAEEFLLERVIYISCFPLNSPSSPSLLYRMIIRLSRYEIFFFLFCFFAFSLFVSVCQD